MYRWLIVRKYLFSRIISFVALVIVASAVALLIVIVSVMEGFRSDIKRRVRGTSSDLKVESTQYVGLKNPERVADVVAQVPGVRATAPYVETLVLFRSPLSQLGDEAEDRYLRVVDVDRESLVGRLDKYVADGAPPDDEWPGWPQDLRTALSPEWMDTILERRLRGRSMPSRSDRPPSVLVGSEQAGVPWFLDPGDLVQLTAFSPREQDVREDLFLVAGYFKTGIYELDSKGILMESSVANDFLGLQLQSGETVASGVRVAAEPGFATEESLERLGERIDVALDEAGVLFTRTLTWQEEKAPLLRAVRIEKAIVSVILGIIVLFSGFMIFIILTVQVVEKTRDLGVLQSMGVTPMGISSIYFLLGLVLCVGGTTIGTLYGVGFSLGVNTIQRWIYLLTGHEVFPRQVFYMDEIPVQFEPYDLVFIIVPMVLASLAASLIPAYRAARKDPVVALRYE